MGNFAVILVLLSLAGIVLSILGLVKGNIKFLKVKGRKSSLLVLISSLVIMLLGGSLLPPVEEGAATQTNPTQQEGLAVQPDQKEVPNDIKSPENKETTTDEKANEPKNEDKQADTTDTVDKAPVKVPVTDENNVDKTTGKTEEKPKDKTDNKAPAKTGGKLQVHYIDVGQGASQLILTPGGKTMLIDGGNNDDEQRVVNYLRKQGVKKVDILIGTHPDADHVGGLDAVVDAFDIGKIYMPKVSSSTKTFESLLTSIANKNLKVTTAKAGITLNLDDQVTVKMIAPTRTYSEKNNMSAVIKLRYGNHSFLFTGDTEAEGERDLISSGADLKSDVLLVGHHGSNSSTSQSFLNAVRPTYAVIQVGKNSYGHPTDTILKRLNDKKIKIYRNDKQGNIVFTTNGEKITVAQNEWKMPASTTTAPKKSTQSSNSATKTETPKKTEPSKSTTTKPEAPVKKDPSQNSSVVYKNCTEVREAGKAPIRRGDPGYSTKLDRDGDGIGCE